MLVTGAGGNLGRRVVELLVEAGASKVIAGTRDPGKVAIAGAETRRVDFSDPASLEAAFAGVDQVLIISTDVIGEVRQKLQRAAVDAAVAAGAKHILYTSLVHPDPDSPVVLAPDHWMTEQAIAATGIDHTFLRNAIYMDALLGALGNVVGSGQWFSAMGRGRIAHITREDCARAAAAALLSGPQGKRILNISGPQPMTIEAIAATVSEVFGKPVSVVHVDDAGLVAGMVAAGLPRPVAELLASFETATRLGQFDVPSDFEKLTGKPPMSLRDFLEANRAAIAA